MLSDAKLHILEVEMGSELMVEVQNFCGESSGNKVTLTALDEADTIVGVCALSSDQMFLNLKCFVKNDVKVQRTIVLDLLTGKAIEITRERFPDFILVVNSEKCNVEEYEQFGFIAITNVTGAPNQLIFPPSCSQLNTLVLRGSCSHSENMCEICDLLQRIASLKYVPLVVLYRAMDVRKLGLSIIRMFVRVAVGVQNIQREQLDTRQANVSLSLRGSMVIKDEARLLSFAWEKLNTGHFSEVDSCWRLMYAAVSLVKSVRLNVAGQHLDAIAAADLGLLMGDCIPDQLLQRYAQFCDRCLPPPRPIQESSEVILTVPKPLPNSAPIPVFTELNKWDFIDQFLAQSKPVIVKGLNSHWIAVRNWSFSYLHSILSRRVVPVEIGSKYTDSDWTQTLMTGSEFFTKCAVLEKGEGPLYLAQHRLFDQVPQLCNDFSLPLYCDHCEDVDRNCWIGPGGTMSPLHTDPRENLFCQIMGRKFFRLVSPAHSENVYAFTDGITTNTSEVDVLNPDLEEYPNFAKAQCWDGVVDGGDVLFIPKGWWHLVSSLSNSISISFWFDA